MSDQKKMLLLLMPFTCYKFSKNTRQLGRIQHTFVHPFYIS